MRSVWVWGFVMLGTVKAFGHGIWWGLGWLAVCGLIETLYRWRKDRA